MKTIFLIVLFMLLMGSAGCGLEPWDPTSTLWENSQSEESVVGDAEEDGGKGLDSDSDASESDATETGSESTGNYPTTSASGDEATTDGQTSSADEAASQFDWNRVLFTEIVTDPQQDHGESSGGNGVPFDATPGTGTVSSSDEYVEIYNGTSETVDISLWGLNMSDGTDEWQDLNDESLVTTFSNGGSIEAFGPGEFVVVGNPKGAMNNTITLELLDENGEIVDSLDVEDANAADETDEAYYLSPEGDWIQGRATPGYFLE